MFDIVARLTRTRPVPYLIAGLLLVLILMSLLPASLDAAQGDQTEVFPVQKAAPATVFIETAGSEVELRRQLRAKNGVSELSSSTSVIRFSVAPTGSFGFITPKLLGLALITQSPDLPLEQMPPVSNAFEIHKLADGSGMLVGFVEANLKPQLTASQRPKNVRLGLYSNPSDKAPHIVAVPLVKLVVDRMPTRLDPKEPGSAVLLDMDLQSTANRTSSQTGP
ncbi:MAG TPA: hypothetical protein VGQ08_01155 [Nitrospiraceae bacterium]|jgi:hypothetical protein|nr:hypothetical protein [Nitrospiraceae bacterium]